MLRRRCVSLLHHVALVTMAGARDETSLRDYLDRARGVSGSTPISISVGLVELAATLRVGPLAIRKDNVVREILPLTTRRNVVRNDKGGYEIWGARTIVLLDSSVTCRLGIVAVLSQMDCGMSPRSGTNTTLLDVRTGARGSLSEKTNNSGT